MAVNPPLYFNDLSVRTALISALFRQVPWSLVAHVVASGVLCILLWGTLPHLPLLLWLAALLALCAARYASFVAFRRSHTSEDDPARWENIGVAFTAAFGLLWALTPWFFLLPENTDTLVLVTVIVMGLGAGASISLAPHVPSCFSFVLPTQLSLIALLVYHGTSLELAIAVLAAYALAANLLNSLSVHRELKTNVRLSHENLSLREEAERKNALLETTLQNMDQGIALSDAEGNLQMWNQRFFELLRAGGAPQRTLAAALGRVNAPLGKAASEVTLDDGDVLQIADNTLANDSHVVTVTDMTQLKKREHDLEQAREVAEQANAAKTRFLAAASHDLRQPIHALGLFFESLTERIPDDPATRPIIDKINDSVEAIDTMLNALLDISKLDAGIVRPSFTRIALGTLLKRLDAEFQPLAAGSGLSLTIRARDLYVRSDELMLERMLRNLITNALRYTPSGGRVLLGVRTRGSCARIEIHDTGIGIPGSQLDEIFLEFHQLGNPERDRRQGLGLGLAIVKRMSMLLDQPVRVRSRLGHGSVFAIDVPLAALAHAEPDEPAPLAALIGREFSDRRALVLDDDGTILDAMQTLLTGWGMQVCAAGSSEEALAKLHAGEAGQHLPDVMIIDYRLRDNATGIEAVETLRERLGRPVPAIFITGDTAPDRLRQAQASGYPLLHKPVRPARLRAALRQLLKTDAA